MARRRSPHWMNMGHLRRVLWRDPGPSISSGPRERFRPVLERLESRLAPASHDTLATAIPLPVSGTQPAQVSGSLDTRNQVDLYAVPLAAGDEVDADVSAQTPDSPQASLRVFDGSGRQLAFQENQASSADTRLTFDALGSGVYYVGVSSNGNLNYDPNRSGNDAGGLTASSYALTLTRKAGAILTQESPLNDTIGTAQQINGNVDGSITGQRVLQGTYINGTTQYYRFTVAEYVTGGGLNATVTPSDGTVLLPRLALYSATEQLLIQSDAVGPAQAAAQLNQHLQPGTYYLAVSAIRDSASSSGQQSYTLATKFDAVPPPFQPLPVRSNPVSVAVGDFNHDGHLDLITANTGAFDHATGTFGASTVSVLLGRGDGTFLPAVSYTVGSFPTSVAVGDFNSDANLDIITANDDGMVSVLLGRGDGTFLPAVSYSVGNIPSSVAVGNFNHDGNLDIVTANSFDNTVSVLLGRGDGTFLPAVSYSVGSFPRSVAVGDFNHDGHLDIVTANPGTFDYATGTYHASTVSVLLGRGDGTFRPAVSSSVGSGPFSVAVGDFNNDANLDIVTANFDNTVSVLLGREDGTFLPAVSYAVGGNPISVAVGDFNHDGNLDIVTDDVNGYAVSVFLGRGNGTFLSAVSYPVGIAPESVAVGDFNRDGNLDLVTANDGDNTVSVLLGREDGTFLLPQQHPHVSYSVGSFPRSVAVGDFTHDGNLDLVTANAGDNTVSVLLGRGDGTFLPTVSYSVGSGPESVAVGDLIHDGNLDIVTANSGDNTVSVLLGREDGTFLPAVSYAVGGFPQSVAVGDFNHDGNLDIAIGNWGPTVSVLLGRGDGTFFPAVYYPVGSDSFRGPNSVAVGDFNHDSNLDLAIGNGNGVSVLLGRGDGTFLPALSYPVGDPASSVAVGDFNHDGNLDLVTANPLSQVSVLLGRGDGTFLPAVSYIVGGFFFPYSVAVGDFNQDGNLDLVTANNGDTTVSVLLGRGDGTFGPAVSYTVGNNPDSVAVGDFNHDGNLDLVTANNGDTTVSVLFGKGNGQFQTATPDNSIALRNVPFLQDLTAGGIPDSVILNSSGALLFRQGLPTPGQFAPPVIINNDLPNLSHDDPDHPDHPARDATVFRTAMGWAVAAVDDAVNPQHLYTVSVYTWDASTKSFRRTVAFTTGNLPVRIAAADLTEKEVNGHPLDDLVVANEFDHSVTIAFQKPDGTFAPPMTRTVGVGPSDIAFANLGGPDGPDIVVSDQVSGDVSVLHNDPSHTFRQQSRYRAGSGLFDINTDPHTGEQTVVSQLQTVGLAAGHFTGSSSDDLVVLNAGAKSFTLLPNLGRGQFANPQPVNPFLLTSAQPSQVASLTLLGDTLPSVAILMEDLHQIWIYRNNGDGTFRLPREMDKIPIPAGTDPTGFSVATVNGRLALLVGNPYGDILTLLYDPSLYDGYGGFALDRANLQHAALAVGTIPSTGQQFAVVANENQDRVSLYYLSGSGQVTSPIPVTATQFPLLAPGAVQTFSITGDPNPYLVVANSLSNNVLLYHYDLNSEQFTQLQSYVVGDNSVSVTVADVNGDGIPDLLVANQGSNDISVLIGSTATGVWTATPYQRLNSGGLGPIAVAVRDVTGDGIPDLLVTNSDGSVFLLPGIGSGGKGSGFFQDNPQLVVDLGKPIMRSVPDPTTGQLFLVGADGSVGVLTGDGFTPVITSASGEFVDAVGTLPTGDLIAALRGGTVELLHLNAATGVFDLTAILTPLDGLPSDPSALAVLETDSGLEVLVTNAGNDQLFVFTLETPGSGQENLPPEVNEIPAPEPEQLVIILPEPVPPSSSVPEVTPPSNEPLVLVVTLVAGNLPEGEAASIPPAPGETETAALGIMDRTPDAVPTAATEVGGDDEEVAALAGDPGGWWESGVGTDVDDALRELDIHRSTEVEGPDGSVSGTGRPERRDEWWDHVLADLGFLPAEGLGLAQVSSEQGVARPDQFLPAALTPDATAAVWSAGTEADLVWLEGLAWRTAAGRPGPGTGEAITSRPTTIPRPAQALPEDAAYSPAPGPEAGGVLLANQRWDVYRACLIALAVGGLACRVGAEKQ